MTDTQTKAEKERNFRQKGIKIPDADALPVPRRKRRKRPMTQAERDALQWGASEVEFDWTNDDWAETWLPWVRLATVFAGFDHDRLKEAMKGLADGGDAPNFLEGPARTKLHLDALY